MRVLFLTDGIFPFQLGGMQKHSLILVKLLAQRKVTVHLVHCGGANYSPESFAALFEEEERKFITETFVKFPKTDPFPGHYIRENKAYSKNIFFELEKVLCEKKSFDLIYAQGFAGWRLIKEKHKKRFSLPILVNFHGLEMYQTAPSLRVKAEYTLFKNSVKWNLRNADYVYSFGGKIDEILFGLGLRPEEVLLQSNGIEKEWLLDSVRKNNDLKKFVFIGRAERRKGIEELNKALELLIASETQFEFNFIGPISKSQQLNDHRIVYHGEIRDVEKIKKLLKEQDCLVCPSHAEGMPTVILEGMASGLAIIGTNVGAVERQIQGNGILLEKPDVVALKKALDHIISTPTEILAAYKRKSLELIEKHFLWERVVEQKIMDFEKCIKASQKENA